MPARRRNARARGNTPRPPSLGASPRCLYAFYVLHITPHGSYHYSRVPPQKRKGKNMPRRRNRSKKHFAGGGGPLRFGSPPAVVSLPRAGSSLFSFAFWGCFSCLLLFCRPVALAGRCRVCSVCLRGLRLPRSCGVCALGVVFGVRLLVSARGLGLLAGLPCRLSAPSLGLRSSRLWFASSLPRLGCGCLLSVLGAPACRCRVCFLCVLLVGVVGEGAFCLLFFFAAILKSKKKKNKMGGRPPRGKAATPPKKKKGEKKMAYQFDNRNIASTKATVLGTAAGDTGIVTHTLNIVSGTQTNADSIMAGINELYGIVGWSTSEVTRTVKQDVNVYD